MRRCTMLDEKPKFAIAAVNITVLQVIWVMKSRFFTASPVLS